MPEQDKPRTLRTIEQGMHVCARFPAVSSFAAKDEARDRSIGGDPRSAAARGNILYIHGLGESGLCFEHMLDQPKLGSWRQLLPDLPGYGRSPWTTEPLSLIDQADHLARWIRRRIHGRGDSGHEVSVQSHTAAGTLSGPLVVLGHSMGGVVGLLLCERHPDIVDSLVVVDGNLSREDCVFSGRAAAMTLDAFLAGGFQRLCDGVFQAGRWDEAQRGYYVSLRLCDPRLYHANSCELLAMSEKEDIASRLSALTFPVTYIAGFPKGICTRSRELLDQAKVRWVDVEPAGHWPFIDQVDGFIAAMEPALGSA